MSAQRLGPSCPPDFALRTFPESGPGSSAISPVAILAIIIAQQIVSFLAARTAMHHVTRGVSAFRVVIVVLLEGRMFRLEVV
jgi:hypothetical protein